MYTEKNTPQQGIKDKIQRIKVGEMVMNDLFIKGIRYVKIKGKLEQVPIYGNYCPRCKTDSENIHCYGDNGLLDCHMCNYVFTIQDMTKTITDFWKKRGCS